MSRRKALTGLGVLAAASLLAQLSTAEVAASTEVPEPTTLTLLGVSLLGMAVLQRLRKP